METYERIKAYRTKYRKITQGELSDLAGINEKYYGRVERNESVPTITIIEKICKALDISLVEFFLLEDESVTTSSFRIHAKEASLISSSFADASDVHFNRSVLQNDRESCLWYNGYVASMLFDEFECKLFVEGNVKAVLYLNGEIVLELNGSDVGILLEKYITNDEELNKLIEFMPKNDYILKKKNGNVLFVEESNWIVGIIDNINTGKRIDEVTFDTDNIFEVLSDRKRMFDYIFG